MFFQCREEAGCTLPMPSDTEGTRTPTLTGDDHELDHEHQEGCGHNQIAHGDHFDWLIPLKDGSGSYVLKHAQTTACGGSHFIEHGRLVKVGESLGQLKRRQKHPIIDLFTYESPQRKGYELLPTTEEISDVKNVVFMKSPCSGTAALPSSQQVEIEQEDLVKVTIPRSFKGQGTIRTTFDVMGICCPSEAPLVKKILEPLPGVGEVLVNPTSKKVTVLHDPKIIADVQIGMIWHKSKNAVTTLVIC
jgi:copper chaperone CopZ